MKKTALLITLTLILTVVSGILCYANVPDSSYQLTFADEFNSTELNTDMWKYRLGATYGGKNLAENVRFANGKLYLDYTKTDGVYSGGGIITNEYLPYGYYETKAKIFTGVNGFHTSFWTAGGILEIDAFEVDSNQETTAPPPYYNLHYWWADHSMVGGTAYDNNTDGNPSTSDWFISGFEWLPGKVIFYSNGKAVGSVSPDVYSPSDLWLTAVAVPDWHKNSDGTYNIDDSKMDANGYFGSSEYEYFRYYNKKLKGVNLLGNGHFELNRQKTSTSTPSFTVTKGAFTIKSPFAYNGYCYGYIPKDAELGQHINYISSGNYTFEGYFKTTSGTSATISVYNKEGTLLKSAAIPVCNDWTLVSLKDIAVTNSAYAVIKTASGSVMADNLSFYCQEGDETYANYKEGDYLNYSALPYNNEHPVLNDAFVAQIGSPVLRYKNSPYVFSKTNTNLVPYKQNNEIYIPYQAIKQHASISGVSSNAEYVTVSQINASGTYVAHTNGSCIIICDKSSSVSVETLMAAQLEHNNFLDAANYLSCTATYAGTSDKAGQKVYDIDTATLSGNWAKSSLGYASNGKYTGSLQGSATWTATVRSTNRYSVQIYSNAHAGATGGAAPSTTNAAVNLIANGKSYNYSLNQYNGSSGWYDLGVIDLNVNDIISIKLYNAAGEGILRASAIRIIPENVGTASYVGTASEADEQILDISKCTLNGYWNESGLGYGGSSKYSTNVYSTANWSTTLSYAGSYSIQIYSIAHAGDTASGAKPSTVNAGVDLTVNGKTTTYSLNQYDGKTGWYDLGTFSINSGENISVLLYNAADGILRANAVKIVPRITFQSKEATYVGTSDISEQTVYDINSCTLSSGWGTSGLGYGGSSRYTSNAGAYAVWDVTPSATGTYSIHLYSIAHAGNPSSGAPGSTTAAGVDVAIGNKGSRYLINQCTGNTGWYDLGKFELTAGTPVSVKMYHTLYDGHLRANAIRIVRVTEAPTAIYVGDTAATNQEVHSFTSATKTGTWLQSGGALWDCYYGNGTGATVTWAVKPQHNKKYSVQIYVPCINNGNTTQTAVVNLKSGSYNYSYTINQRLDTTANKGWYDLGIFDLTTSSTVTVKLSMTSGQFLRARDIRLVPVPDSIPASVSNGTVTITPGFISNHIKKILFAEYNSLGELQNTQILEPSASMRITMENASNKFKIFFWENIHSMIPVVPAIESN